MKRILTIVCCTMALFTISSCTKQYVTPNPNFSVTATVNPSDWILYTDSSDGNQSYEADIAVSDVGNNIVNYGGIIVAVSYDGGNVYEQIPEVYKGVSYSYTYNAGTGGQPGDVSIYAQTADGSAPFKPTDAIKVKITLVSGN